MSIILPTGVSVWTVLRTESSGPATSYQSAAAVELTEHTHFMHSTGFHDYYGIHRVAKERWRGYIRHRPAALALPRKFLRLSPQHPRLAVRSSCARPLLFRSAGFVGLPRALFLSMDVGPPWQCIEHTPVMTVMRGIGSGE
jgi:hypothetical protein